MKSTKQVLITLAAVILLLMPTSAMAVIVIDTEGVGGDASGIPVSNAAELKTALSGIGSTIEITGNIAVDETITFGSGKDFKLISNGLHTISRAADYNGTMFNVVGSLNIEPSSKLIFDGTTKTMNGTEIVVADNVKATGSIFNIAQNANLSIHDNVEIVGNSMGNNSKGGAVYAVAGSTLSMDGGAISNNSAECGAGIYSMGAVFISGEATVTKNKATDRGAGILVCGASALLEMNGGHINFNKADGLNKSGNAGGVRVENGANFVMGAGEIRGNTTSTTNTKDYANGAGVSIASSSFTMNGGIISGNVGTRGDESIAGVGAGVYVFTNVGDTNSSFYALGGEIINNGKTEISGEGHQIYVRDNGCSFVLEGCKVTETNAYAGGCSIYISDSKSIVSLLTTSSQVCTLGGRTDDINGTFFVDGSATVACKPSFRTTTTGLNAKYSDGSTDIVKFRYGVIINNDDQNPMTASVFKSWTVSPNITDLYIDPVNGSDTNGGEGSDKPLRTLSFAYTLMSCVNLSGKSITIHVMNTINIDSIDDTTISKTGLVEGTIAINVNPSELIFSKEGDYTGPMFSVKGNLSANGVSFFNPMGVDDNADNDIISEKGGAVRINNGSFIMTDTTITGFIANLGGAIFLTGDNGKFEMTGGSVSKCYAKTVGSTDGSGGFLYAENGNATIYSGTISECGATYGAAVRINSFGKDTSKFGNVVMEDGLIKENQSTRNGSAVSIRYGSFTMNGGTITDNTAGTSVIGSETGDYLGAIQVLHGGRFVMNNGSLINNTTMNTLYSNTMQVFVQYGGIAVFNGGTFKDNNSNSGSVLFYKGSTACGTLKVGSGYSGTVVAYGTNLTRTISNNKSLPGAGYTSVDCTCSNGNNPTYRFTVETVMSAEYYATVTHGTEKYDGAKRSDPVNEEHHSFGTMNSDIKAMVSGWYKFYNVIFLEDPQDYTLIRTHTFDNNESSTEIKPVINTKYCVSVNDEIEIRIKLLSDQNSILINNDVIQFNSSLIALKKYIVISGISNDIIVGNSYDVTATITTEEVDFTKVYGETDSIDFKVSASNFISINCTIQCADGFFATPSEVTVGLFKLNVEFTVMVSDQLDVDDDYTLVVNLLNSSNNIVGTYSHSYTVTKADGPAVTETNNPEDTGTSIFINHNAPGSVEGNTVSLMEYKRDGDTGYTGCTDNTIEDLRAGTYSIRYAEDDNHNPGPDYNFTIAPPGGYVVMIEDPMYGGIVVGKITVNEGETEVLNGHYVDEMSEITISVSDVDQEYNLTGIYVGDDPIDNGGTFTVSSDVTITATVERYEVTLGCTIDPVAEGYDSAYSIVSVNNGNVLPIHVRSLTATEHFSITSSDARPTIYGDETYLGFRLNADHGLSEGTYVCTLTLTYDVGSLTYQTETLDIQFTVCEGEIVVNVTCNGVSIVDGDTLTATNTEGIELTVSSETNLSYLGIDSVISDCIVVTTGDVTINVEDSTPRFREAIISVGTSSDYSGCFYIGLYFVGDNGSCCFDMYVNMIPSAEILTDPSA